MYVIILLCLLIFPIVFFLGLKPSVALFLGGLAFGIGIITALSVLFGPKIWLLMNGMDLDRNLNIVKVVGRGSSVVATKTQSKYLCIYNRYHLYLIYII